MRYFFASLACAGLLCAALGAATPALAHRVNIFAYVEQSDIIVECSFSKSSKVRQGTVEARDAVSGEVLARATTDDNGTCRLPVPEKARKAGHGVILRIIAGEGHQNEWTVEADELAAANTSATTEPAAAQQSTQTATAPNAATANHSAAPAGASATAAPASASSPAASTPSASAPAATHATAPATASTVPAASAPTAAAPLTRADVESIVGHALDSRLSPITRMLAASQDSGPTLRDIIGGLGWLLGLCGIAAYFHSRKA